MTRHSWIRVALTLLLILGLTAACAPSETQVLVALFDEWAREKGFNPRDEEGNIDVMGVLGVVKTAASAVLTGSTGDEEADAAVGILSVVYPIKGYDEQTDKGLDTRDPTQIQNAVEGRPNDYHYRNALAVALLANGDVKGSDAAFREASAAWRRSNPKGSESYGNQVNTRDTLGCLDRAIKAADQNGTSFENWHSLRARYCDEAIKYYNQTKSETYLKNARDKLGIDCSKY
jgi:hypothetical protein